MSKAYSRVVGHRRLSSRVLGIYFLTLSSVYWFYFETESPARTQIDKHLNRIKLFSGVDVEMNCRNLHDCWIGMLDGGTVQVQHNVGLRWDLLLLHGRHVAANCSAIPATSCGTILK